MSSIASKISGPPALKITRTLSFFLLGMSLPNLVLSAQEASESHEPGPSDESAPSEEPVVCLSCGKPKTPEMPSMCGNEEHVICKPCIKKCIKFKIFHAGKAIPDTLERSPAMKHCFECKGLVIPENFGEMEDAFRDAIKETYKANTEGDEEVALKMAREEETRYPRPFPYGGGLNPHASPPHGFGGYDSQARAMHRLRRRNQYDNDMLAAAIQASKRDEEERNLKMALEQSRLDASAAMGAPPPKPVQNQPPAPRQRKNRIKGLTKYIDFATYNWATEEEFVPRAIELKDALEKAHNDGRFDREADTEACRLLDSRKKVFSENRYWRRNQVW